MTRILHVIPFRGLFPPKNGGQLRSFYLMKELARKNSVTAVVLQPEAELLGQKDGYEFPESIDVFSADNEPLTPNPDWLSRLRQAARYRWSRRSLQGPANRSVLRMVKPIRRALQKSHFDLALFEGLDAMRTATIVRRLSPKTARVIDAHNIDHMLARHYELQNRVARGLEYVESHLAAQVNAFFACSDHDRDELLRLNRNELPGFTIPNGVDTKRVLFDPSRAKARVGKILFCGSLDYVPNIEGLQWFYTEIWPSVLRLMSSLRLVVIGRGPKRELHDLFNADSSVDFIGAVDDVLPFYHNTSISIVPLRSGSGTRLKILEAMSAGNPVISTSIGAQGIAAESGKHLLIANTAEQFAASITDLLSAPEIFESLRRQARALVESTYDWCLIGDKLCAAIAQIAEHAWV